MTIKVARWKKQDLKYSDKYLTRKCPVCTKEFMALREGAIYDTPKCREMSHQVLIPLFDNFYYSEITNMYNERVKTTVQFKHTCKTCDKEFNYRLSQGRCTKHRGGYKNANYRRF